MAIYRYIVVLMLLALAACTQSVTLPQGVTTIEPAKPLVAVPMTDHEGAAFDLDKLVGRWVLLEFGYTHCPDVCPINLAEMRMAHLTLAEQGLDVALVFVSVDGARDTPEHLKTYLSYFNAPIYGLTGDTTRAQALIDQFGGRFVINDAGGLIENYTVDHTASIFLLNPQGQWVRTYAYGIDIEILTNDVGGLIRAAL
jgi:protein SCO1